jgi:hypothetical protein
MLKRTILIAPLVATCLLLSSHAAEASEPGFGAVTWHFDLSHEVGDQGIKTIPITIEAKKKPDGTFAAEYVKDWFLDKTTHAQFFVQETDGLGVSAGWKDIDITCGNNLADPTSQPPSDQPDLRVLKSKFTVTTFQNDSATGCPVNAALDVEFITNKPGGVPFKVTNTDGFVWNFSIKATRSSDRCRSGMARLSSPRPTGRNTGACCRSRSRLMRSTASRCATSRPSRTPRLPARTISR